MILLYWEYIQRNVNLSIQQRQQRHLHTHVYISTIHISKTIESSYVSIH
jgi:hypothetical protein